MRGAFQRFAGVPKRRGARWQKGWKPLVPISRAAPSLQQVKVRTRAAVGLLPLGMHSQPATWKGPGKQEEGTKMPKNTMCELNSTPPPLIL